MAVWLMLVLAAVVLAVIGLGTAAWWLFVAALVLLVAGIVAAVVRSGRTGVRS